MTMINSPQPTSRETLDIIIQRTILIYRYAVLATFALIGVGFVITIFTDQNVDATMAAPLTLLGQAFDLEASGLFGLGIAAMIVTPIVMIANAALTFFRSGDRKYGLITTAVAAILTLSIVISFVIG